MSFLSGGYYDKPYQSSYSDEMKVCRLEQENARLRKELQKNALSVKEQALLVDFLKELSDRFGNDGCNDWDFPITWTQREVIDFVKDFHAWNGDPEEFSENNLNLPNYAVVEFLAHKLVKD